MFACGPEAGSSAGSASCLCVLIVFTAIFAELKKSAVRRRREVRAADGRPVLASPSSGDPSGPRLLSPNVFHPHVKRSEEFILQPRTPQL